MKVQQGNLYITSDVDDLELADTLDGKLAECTICFALVLAPRLKSHVDKVHR